MADLKIVLGVVGLCLDCVALIVVVSLFILYALYCYILGRTYGPPGTKRLIYFIDDMNMPEVDTYGTVQPHTLIRQHLDYQHW